MSKFTPGPWQVKRYANNELQTDFVMVVIGDRVHMIGYSEEDAANARLIAAAPAMYEALKKCADFAAKTGSEPDVLIVIMQQIAKISEAALEAAERGSK